MTQYWVPPDGKLASIAPSLSRKERGIGTKAENNGTPTEGIEPAPYPYGTVAELNNPTVIPEEMLKKFHFTFLIRHPRSSVPSYYRCTVPPLDKITGFSNFMPSEAGYDELRRTFDYLRANGHIGPDIAGGKRSSNGDSHGNSHTDKVDICVVDADDLLDNPEGIIEAYCKTVGISYDPKMLIWDTDEDQKHAKDAFEKWSGFHDDAIHSSGLKPRMHVSQTFIL